MANVREQLVKEAVALLRQGGPEAVTTTAVAHAVGIRQPSVYAHFRNRQALLNAAINQVAEDMAQFTRQAQTELRAAGADDPDALHVHFGRIIDNARAHRGLISVWLAHRDERSELGEALRDVDEMFVVEIAEHAALLRPSEAGEALTACDRFARVVLESVAGSLRLHLAGHLPKDDTVRILVNQVFAATTLLP